MENNIKRNVDDYKYCYACVKRTTKMCYDVHSSTCEEKSDDIDIVIQIPFCSDEYFFKYYDEATGKWYTNKEMTPECEWIPPVA